MPENKLRGKITANFEVGDPRPVFTFEGELSRHDIKFVEGMLRKRFRVDYMGVQRAPRETREEKEASWKRERIRKEKIAAEKEAAHILAEEEEQNRIEKEEANERSSNTEETQPDGNPRVPEQPSESRNDESSTSSKGREPRNFPKIA